MFDFIVSQSVWWLIQRIFRMDSRDLIIPWICQVALTQIYEAKKIIILRIYTKDQKQKQWLYGLLRITID